MTPREGSTIQIRKNGTLNFSWEETEGANAYILSLYNEANEELPVFQTEPRSGTVYIHRDLSGLDAGAFFWRLEAVRVSPGGAVFQRGRAADCHFRIIIPQSASPQLREPGILYGN
jgi:hypothetical protein